MLYQTKYDTELMKIPHFQSYPQMLPYVGPHFGSGLFRPTILIGESHYLDHESTVHRNDTQWYKGVDEDLSDKEKSWIHTRNILSEVEGSWNNEGHKIYKNIDSALHEAVPGHEERLTWHFTFMNGYQRPAPRGESMKNHSTDVDRVYGNDVISKVIDIIRPEYIVFVSKHSWEAFFRSIQNCESNVEAEFVYHPGDNRWWNSRRSDNGKPKFKQVVKGRILIQ